MHIAATQTVNESKNNKTLPAWIYNDQNFFELEKKNIFNSSWLIACHVSEIPNAGDFITLSFMSERALVSRMADGSIKAVQNTCRHRAHQVVAAASGNCKRVHVCPYHGWSYNQDGSLRGIPGASPEQFQQAGCGLPAIDSEVFMGFVWIRFDTHGPSVAERLAAYAPLLAAFKIDEMLPNNDLVEEEHPVDWKNMMDNYLEGYHVPMGHPNLNEMMESAYDVVADSQTGTNFATQRMRDEPNGKLDERAYLSALPVISHLPDDHARRWSYLSLFPNVNIGLQPHCVDFFVVYPIAPGRAKFRSASYSLPDERPEMKQACAAAERVWETVQEEDNQLTASVQRGLEGSSYQYGYLAPAETGVRAFRDWLQQRLPLAKQMHRP